MHINIGLTALGVKNYNEVLRLIFAFINLVRVEGPKEYIYQEMKVMREINFANKTKGAALNTANNMASKL